MFVRESWHDDLHVIPVERDPERRVIAERVGKPIVEIPGRVADNLPFFARDGRRLSRRGVGPWNRLRWGYGGGALQALARSRSMVVTGKPVTIESYYSNWSPSITFRELCSFWSFPATDCRKRAVGSPRYLEGATTALRSARLSDR